jgi:hypothetical protein
VEHTWTSGSWGPQIASVSVPSCRWGMHGMLHIQTFPCAGSSSCHATSIAKPGVGWLTASRDVWSLLGDGPQRHSGLAELAAFLPRDIAMSGFLWGIGCVFVGESVGHITFLLRIGWPQRGKNSHGDARGCFWRTSTSSLAIMRRWAQTRERVPGLQISGS